MGMFDEIKCEYSLPEAALQDVLFQTKSLDRLMDRYTITRDGRLIHHTVRYELIPEAARPFYGKPEWEKPLLQFCGMFKGVSTGDVEVPYHGDIYFYTSSGAHTDNNFEWFEYQARFTEGRVQWIKRVLNRGKA